MTPEHLARGFAERHPLPDWHAVIMTRVTGGPDYAPRLERFIGACPYLSSRLLALANSSLYGFPSPIGVLPMLTTVLGPRTILDLLHVLAAAHALKSLRLDSLDMEAFWQHAVFTGLLARQQGVQPGLHAGETLFLAGLLHDAGKLVIHEQLPAEGAVLRRWRAAGKHHAFRLEQDLLGFDHTTTGAALLRAWRLPDAVISVARHHHRCGRARLHNTLVAAVAEAERRAPGPTTGTATHGTETPPAAERGPELLELELQAVELQELLFGDHGSV